RGGRHPVRSRAHPPVLARDAPPQRGRRQQGRRPQDPGETVKMKKLATLALSLCLGAAVAACGKVSTKPLYDALKAQDLAKAEALSAELLKEQPDNRPVPAARFVLFRHLAVHGAAEKQAQYNSQSIKEYDALATALGLKADYANMEDSLRGSPEGK